MNAQEIMKFFSILHFEKSSWRYYNTSKRKHKDFEISPEVAEALKTRKPIVALESTIISHGMPYPQNFETALAVENIIREHGSIPATIAILNGKINVGLTPGNLERLAKMGPQAIKTSRRDLAFVLSQGMTGATTVASTMLIAHMAGIKVFVTGGIGGVHRDGENTMDVSADLTELGRTPVAVVCAGVKSILDIEKTLEYLETQGVAVVTFGETKDFPGFFTSKSGFKSPSNLSSTLDCAKLIRNNKHDLNSGILIAVPVPENEAAESQRIQSAIEESLKGAIDKGIRGKEVTPYLLKKVNEMTQGGSLKSNISLIKNNAKIGSQIAERLSYLENKSTEKSQKPVSFLKPDPNGVKSKERIESSPVLIVGGAVVDITSTLRPPEYPLKHSYDTKDFLETSFPGDVNKSIGGVGRNIAETVFRLGLNPLFASVIGNDEFGKWFIAQLEMIGMDSSNLRIVKNQPTAVYNAINKPDGSLLCAVADMKIFDHMSFDEHELVKNITPKLVCFDGNISEDCIRSVLNFCSSKKIPAFFEPTSVPKSVKIFKDKKLFSNLLTTQTLRYISPNRLELESMFNIAKINGFFDSIDWFNKLDEFNIGLKYRQDLERLCRKHEKLQELNDLGIFSIATQLLPYIPIIIIKLDKDGVLLVQNLEDIGGLSNEEHTTSKADRVEIIVRRKGKGGIRYKYFKPFPLMSEHIVNVTGAGDSFIGTLISGLALYDETKIDKIVDKAQQIACMTLQSHNAVSENINADLLKF
ncbi:18602_t:CDS:10 [Acaulospora morrowiae]|uniref:18602_t:CDS:1 n=1 Tax=Acaulospora morrowiae TaxID=94023 RepID=A0A9N9F1Y6_9GLOM|nr:18602_t:CDS:10 [Acaulospora morrowiae]